MNNITLFQHEQFGRFRVIERGGESWFVNPDVCRACGISDARQAVESLDDDERYIVPVTDSLGRKQDTYIISEAGLYSLILRSRRPEAKAFKRWVTHEVLPAIRKNRGYLFANENDTPESIMARAVLVANDAIERMKTQIAADRPKILFADAVTISDTAILIGDMAKLLKQNGVNIGQKRFFAWLRDNGYLMKVGESRNMPTQYAMTHGWFVVTERILAKPDGSPRIVRTTKITGLGQVFFMNKFIGKEAAHVG